MVRELRALVEFAVFIAVLLALLTTLTFAEAIKKGP